MFVWFDFLFLGSHRPWKVLEFAFGPGKLLKFEKWTIWSPWSDHDLCYNIHNQARSRWSDNNLCYNYVVLIWQQSIVRVCNCSMFCCTLLYDHSRIAIILMGKRELIALLNLSFWCLVMVERLFLAVPRGCLQFVIVVFPDHTHLLFLLRYP